MNSSRTGGPVARIFPGPHGDVSPEAHIRVEQSVAIQADLIVRDLQQRLSPAVVLQRAKVGDKWWSHVHKV
jgi:hypothetical protein